MVSVRQCNRRPWGTRSCGGFLSFSYSESGSVGAVYSPAGGATGELTITHCTGTSHFPLLWETGLTAVIMTFHCQWSTAESLFFYILFFFFNFSSVFLRPIRTVCNSFRTTHPYWASLTLISFLCLSQKYVFTQVNCLSIS